MLVLDPINREYKTRISCKILELEPSCEIHNVIWVNPLSDLPQPVQILSVQILHPGVLIRIVGIHHVCIRLTAPK